MKKLLLYSTILVMTTLIGCKEQATHEKDKGIDLENMDTSYVPGDDFYMYATGGWQRAILFLTKIHATELLISCVKTIKSNYKDL